MSCRSLIGVLLSFFAISAAADRPVLLRNTEVASARTPRGVIPLKLTAVTLPLDVTVILLTGTFRSDDVLRVRRSISLALPSSFLRAHTVRVIPVSSVHSEEGVPLTTMSQLTSALARVSDVPVASEANDDLFSTLGGVIGTLPGSWGRVVVVGRLPAADVASGVITAFVADAFRSQRVSVSFWSLDGAVPDWAQNLCAATAGMVATSDISALLPTLNDSSSAFSEAVWESKLSTGGWPYVAELLNSGGERMVSVQTIMAAPGFAPPIPSYLALRKAMLASGADIEATAKAVLAVNPSDVDGLQRLAGAYASQHRPKDSAAMWHRVVEITPQDGNAWGEIATQHFASGSYDQAEQALAHAANLGVTNKTAMETKARLSMHRHDFAAALSVVEQMLANEKSDQGLWLLRADCAEQLQRWPVVADSLEHAVALGPVALERNTELINGYLSAGQVAMALPRLRAITPTLPNDANVKTQYASLWERSHDGAAAEKLWKTAIAADPKFGPAYLGLAKHYLDNKQTSEALRISESGLEAAPHSGELILIKEIALESLGDTYGARRFLKERAPGTKDIDLLKRWAHLEDCCGNDGAHAYLALLAALEAAKSNQVELTEVCRRGLMVSIRSERYQDAKTFADKLASAGDKSGLALLSTNKTSAEDRVDLLGGADALHFLLLGNAKSKPDGILLDYSHVLSSLATNTNASLTKAEWQKIADKIHEYFRILSSVAALGTRKADHYELTLSLKNKPDKQRTEKVLGILGLKLKNGKDGLIVGSSEGKSQIKKQDTLAALALDDQGIEEALAAGKNYKLEIPVDSVPVFPAAALWQQSFPGHENLPGGLFELFLTDEHLPQLYVGLNSMDRAAAKALNATVSLRALADHVCAPLALFSAALAMHGRRVEVPGGDRADLVWQQLTGVRRDEASAFFQSLLTKDDGRLVAYFYTLSELDMAHQRLFTRSPARAKRFYDLFRESTEMKHGDRQLGANSTFTTFLREVPLTDDGSVDFPGDAELWMVAKGASTSGGSVAKLNRKLKRTVAPDDEDEILIRLAGTRYKSQERSHSELANFIAVSRIDAERDHPLDRDSALLLAQGYTEFEGLYSYFAELGDLEAGDYQRAFSLAGKLNSMDVLSANNYLGEVHTFLAMLGLLRENGVASPTVILQLFRKGLDRFLNANDPVARMAASEAVLDDLLVLNLQKTASHDEGVRQLLLGERAAGPSGKSYRQVLAMQKAPSLDSFYSIKASLAKVNESPVALDEIQRQLATFEVLTPPKTWKLTGERKKHLEQFQTAEAQSILVKLRDKLSKRKRNPADIEKLSYQLMAELEPWLQLSMVGQIYARFLDPTDMVVSEDAMLLRKHEFVDLGPKSARREWFPAGDLSISSDGEGSYMAGGLAAFSISAGRARAVGNHLGGNAGGSLTGALYASVRATDWRTVTPVYLRSFGAAIRLAREWIVESAVTPAMYQELEQDTLGLLSLVRREALLESLTKHDWNGVWQSLSVSDLHFLGDNLLESAPKDLWSSDLLTGMNHAAAHGRELNALGSVAPELSGCTQPRLRRYEPYEEYQRHYSPNLLAQRLSELKLYLAAMADDSAWPLEAFPILVSRVTDDLAAKQIMRDSFDWAGALDSYRKLKAEDLEPLLSQP